MVLHFSDSRPSFSEFRDLSAPSSNNVDQDKIFKFKAGYFSMKKKHQHPRTEEDDGGDDKDNDEFSRKKKSKKNNSEREASFVALVTVSNLHNDALHLPKDFTSSNDILRRCGDIVINDGGERSWTLELKFNESSDTFYVSRGWRSFCDENGKKAGGLFVFRLMANAETPLLSFGPAESRGEKSSKKESLPVELNSGEKTSKEKRKENPLRYKNSTSPGQNRFVTLTIPDDSFRKSRLYLPLPFMRENGMTEFRLITLLGKDGTKWLVKVLREGNRAMCLGKGWKEFAKANGLQIGESFTFELIWEEETPMLNLFSTESSSSTRQQGESCSKAKEKVFAPTEPSSGNKTKKAKNIREERRYSSSPGQNRFVTLTLTAASFRRSRLCLPLPFTRENGMIKPRLITLLGKDGTKWSANLLREGTGRMSLGKGWIEFAKANGLKIGYTITLELVWENETPMLSLFSTESSNGTMQQGEYGSKVFTSTEPTSENKTKKAKNNREEKRDSSSTIQHRFVTLTLTPDDVRDCKLILPSQYMKANGIDKLGKITLLGKDGTKWFAYLLSKDGFASMGCGWKSFCEANGVKTGESFTLECVCEQDTTYVFKFWSSPI